MIDMESIKNTDEQKIPESLAYLLNKRADNGFLDRSDKKSFTYAHTVITHDLSHNMSIITNMARTELEEAPLPNIQRFATGFIDVLALLPDFNTQLSEEAKILFIREYTWDPYLRSQRAQNLQTRIDEYFGRDIAPDQENPNEFRQAMRGLFGNTPKK